MRNFKLKQLVAVMSIAVSMCCVDSYAVEVEDVFDNSNNVAKTEGLSSTSSKDSLVINKAEQDFVPEDLPSSPYVYTVPFYGSFEDSNLEAFELLLKDLSNGSTQASSLNVDLNNLILAEDIDVDGNLKVVFSEEQIKQLMSSGKIMVWNGLVDPVIFWLVKGSIIETLDSDNNPTTKIESHIIGGEDKDTLIEEFVSQGLDNKIKAIVPIFDLSDIESINISDITLGDVNKISAVSSMYTKGLAISGMYQQRSEGLILSYHVINVETKEELFNETVIGNEKELASKLYDAIKSYLGNSQATNNASSAQSDLTYEMVNTSSLEGFTDINALNLGRNENDTRILVHNVISFKQIMDLKSSLVKIGLIGTEATDLKGFDVVFSIPNARLGEDKALLKIYPALISTDMDNVYIFDAAKANQILTPEDDAKSSENDVNENKVTSVDSSIVPLNDNNKVTPNNALDPNRKYRTTKNNEK